MQIPTSTRNFFLGVLLACCATAAAAQGYPDRPIKLIVPYAAGQGTDVAARFVAERLAQEIGGNIIVENRAGAGGNIGTQLAAKVLFYDPENSPTNGRLAPFEY